MSKLAIQLKSRCKINMNTATKVFKSKKTKLMSRKNLNKMCLDY